MRCVSRRRMWQVSGLALALSGATVGLRAQSVAIPVFDQSNYYEDLVQVYDLAEQVTNMFFQAQPLPVNMWLRYNVFSPLWAFNTIFGPGAQPSPVASALNTGDPTGAAYRQTVDPLASPAAALATMPPELQRRFLDDYSAIELSDSVAALGIDQSGTARGNGNALLEVLEAMKADAFSPDGTFQTETALLNKINSATVVGLQETAQTNQFLSSALEALLLANSRQREAEAKLMNATIAQWQYGSAYGDSLFSHTAVDLDTWTWR